MSMGRGTSDRQDAEVDAWAGGYLSSEGTYIVGRRRQCSTDRIDLVVSKP